MANTFALPTVWERRITSRIMYGCKTFGPSVRSEDEYARYIRLRAERYAQENARYALIMRWIKVAAAVLFIALVVQTYGPHF